VPGTCCAHNRPIPAPLPHKCLQDILAYEGGATLTVEGQELGPGDLKILRDFQPPAGTKPGKAAGPARTRIACHIGWLGLFWRFCTTSSPADTKLLVVPAGQVPPSMLLI